MGRHILTCNPGILNADGALSLAFRAPSAALGGGVTVVGAYASTGAAGTLDICLVNFGTSGTVVGGTIAKMSGGTATVWAIDTPQSLTITAAQAFVDADEYVYIKKLEAGGSDDLTTDAAVIIEVVDGVVTQG